jgi:hypothetical protein
MINLEVEGSIQKPTLLYRHQSWPNSVIAIKRDDAIRAALPILQRSQGGQTSYALTKDPKLEDALKENTPSVLPSFALISMHITSSRAEDCATHQPGHFVFVWLSESSSLGGRLRAGFD